MSANAEPILEVSPSADFEHSLVDRYRSVRAVTEQLAQPLSPEDQAIQSMPDCSPTKWHRAHTSWFFETFVLAQHSPGYRPFDDRFGFLFNSYYEAVGPRWLRSDRGLLSRPSAERIRSYRGHVDDAMEQLLAGPDVDAYDLFVLGLHHEQQHQELLLMDAKHMLSHNPIEGAYRTDLVRAATVPERPISWVEVGGGPVDVGSCGDGFAFDNELPRHSCLLRPFRLADRPVSNGEWRDFVDDGGYQQAELWLADGWAAVQAQGWTSPLYWIEDREDWVEFTLGGVRTLDPAAPVCHVSFYEADAFARWSGARLPLEAEWEIAVGDQSISGNLLEADRLHPAPTAPTGERFVSAFGDVWEWTASHYVAYPGFRPAKGAVGEYNGKFMCNQQVLRGGSCLTPAAHVRATYRNFYPPAARWACSGVRLARDE